MEGFSPHPAMTGGGRFHCHRCDRPDRNGYEGSRPIRPEAAGTLNARSISLPPPSPDPPGMISKFKIRFPFNGA